MAANGTDIPRRPVRQLSVDVARKIAAGEVIDRPAAIMRELLDNAVDSGADSITAEIKGGGIQKIRIADNGTGMTRDDLANCARPHATSKITDALDLMKLTTLGFRGEALASIAAVSRLTVSSGTWRMKASVAEDHVIEKIPPVQNGAGTIVQSEGLFENFPARRVFLKRPSSETALCRDTFIEKALPRPDISFRLTIDGSIRHDLPAGVTRTERLVRALELKESASLFSELQEEGFESDGKSKWRFSLVIGEPAVYRNDRKHIFIFVNGRRVQEYSLVQAIEYGCQGFFPNGTHPVAALFVQAEPHLVDFNIHPAKKEVKFRDISPVHHGVSSTVRAFFRSYGIKESAPHRHDETEKNENVLFSISHTTSGKTFAHSALFLDTTDTKTEKDSFVQAAHLTVAQQKKSAEYETEHSRQTRELLFRNAEPEKKQHKNDFRFTPETAPEFSHPAEKSGSEKPCSVREQDAQPEPDSESEYLGTLFGTFIALRKNDKLYLIDQHAAHERILFNRILAGGAEKQELLVPYTIQTESEQDDEYLENLRETLSAAGFTCRNKGNGRWEFSSVPARWTGTQKELEEALLAKRTSPQEIVYHIAATTACKAAVKDGTTLGRTAAEQLAEEALALSDPHCPHGRPIWTVITKEELFARVRRT